MCPHTVGDTLTLITDAFHTYLPAYDQLIDTMGRRTHDMHVHIHVIG